MAGTVLWRLGVDFVAGAHFDPLRTLRGLNRSSCGAVRKLNQPSAHFGWVESLSLWRGAHLEAEVSFRSVDHKCRSEESVGSVDRSVARKCRVPQKCCQKCGSEALLRTRTVAQIRSVDRTCCSEVSIRSGSEVLLKSAAHISV